ncbi:hypothetical protein ATE84_2915 [Aquimarina sp. MAR_2010_214]|uniref:hypothetical protein n=1 Tax=Aquimarina sp. MAR_2010_214 TaxID=1250026 RepID=UPI000C700F73|nr:hypothetical protein [Aquimarina sp. MAR_2010_214]PKV50848.1 hypothetical protein ATE84_2915 [Aquimarina sp. MAR_2010_214]
MTNLEKYINDNSPILSGELLETLMKSNKGLSNEAARKRISRIKGDIIRIRGLFADGQILFCSKEVFGSGQYYEGLSQAFKISGKQYHIILQSLDFHYGQIRLNQLPSYSVNPIENLKGHITFSSALEKLENLKLVNTGDEFVTISSSIVTNALSPNRAKGIETAKNFLLIQFNDWARKIGLSSYNSSKFHSSFGNYQFNFVSPSYVGSLPKKGNKALIPGFVVADILIGNSIVESEVEFFINKIRVLKYRKGVGNFIPFLIVDSMDTKALNSLKAEGVVIGFVDELFGDKYKELLNSLINLVTNAGAILKKNPEAYLDLILKLNKLVDGKTNNLRGDLFELAVGYYQGRICQTIDIGKMIIHEGNRREIDVFGLLPNSIFISECKGYNSKIDKEEVETWLGEKVPVIRKWILEQASLSEREITFQFWSTGGFTQEAIEYLEKKKSNTKKYNIDFIDLEQMIKLSKEFKSKKFTEILRDYYIREI